MAKYYYNESENSFYIAENFVPNKSPKGFVEISKERYEELTNPEGKEKPEEQ